MNKAFKRIARDRFERLIDDDPGPPPPDLVVMQRRLPLRIDPEEEDLDAATRAQAEAILEGRGTVPGEDIVEHMDGEGLFDVPTELSDDVLVDAQAAFDAVPRHPTMVPPPKRVIQGASGGAARRGVTAPAKAEAEAAKAPRRLRKMPFEPDEQVRRMVEMMSAMGVSLTDIANCVTDPRSGRAINVQLLRRMFERELSTGNAKATVQVGSKLFLAASSCASLVEEVMADGRRVRRVDISPAGVQAAIFWLRSRGGFRPSGGAKGGNTIGGGGGTEAAAARAESAKQYGEMDLDDLTRILTDRFAKAT